MCFSCGPRLLLDLLACPITITPKLSVQTTRKNGKQDSSIQSSTNCATRSIISDLLGLGLSPRTCFFNKNQDKPDASSSWRNTYVEYSFDTVPGLHPTQKQKILNREANNYITKTKMTKNNSYCHLLVAYRFDPTSVRKVPSFVI